MFSKDEIEKRVIEHINKNVGSEMINLQQASLLAKTYSDRSQKIYEKLNYEVEENISSYKSAFQSQEQVSQSIKFQMNTLSQFGKRLEAKIDESTALLQQVQPHLDQIRKLQQLVNYLKIVQDIQGINNSLSLAVSGKDEAKMVNLYLTLFEDNDHENSIIGRLSGVDATFLKLFAIRTAKYWHLILKQRFSSELEAILQSMRWGQKEEDSLSFVPPRESYEKAHLLAEYLFMIKCPAEEAEPLQAITPSIFVQPVSTVTKLLLAPYRKRFLYHFTGARQTNRLDKPEWFYTQILNWGKESHLIVGKIFQPAAIRAGKLDFNIRLEFMRGLVQLAIEKVAVDIEEISRDQVLFAHLLDETLSFEAELRETFGYPASLPSAVCVITQPVYLLKWIALEERFCTEKIDFILQGDNPWALIDPNTLDDELKIPKCADQFLRLLDAIKDRYYSLIQPGHQLQFLNLQLELIDNFRRRLVQLHNSDMVGSIPILNAINYVTMVLREWGEAVHYLHLHATLLGPNVTEINSVFEQPISELEHWTHQLIQKLTNRAVNDIKAKSMPYRHNCWAAMTEQNSNEPLILSPSAGEMLQVVVSVLHTLDSELSPNLFNLVLRLVAKHLDNYIYDTLIVITKFSPAGAAQFNYDMTRNLFALFGQYNKRPDMLFKKICDSIKLLTLPRGTALLLHETLQSNSTYEEMKTALRELGIQHFKPNTCIDVLERRTDIRIL